MKQAALIAKKQIINNLGHRIFDQLSNAQMVEPRGNYNNQASEVIRPKNTMEVSIVLSILNEHKVGIVPYAGGTGLVGGQMAPVSDYFLLSLDRMKKLRQVSSLDGILTVEAGMTLLEVRNEAKKLNRNFPLSLASEGTCQIGGNLATNAGGINVVKYGNIRNLCLGVEAVFANGQVYNGLHNLFKDNTGYDVRSLLIGSEGTLGIITAANLRTYPIQEEKLVSIVQVLDVKEALTLFRSLQDKLPDQIQAFELISSQALEFLDLTGFNFKEPFKERSEWMVLVELSAPKYFDIRRVFERKLSEALEKGLVIDAVISENEAQINSMWYIRENISEANKRVGAIVSSDISVPIFNIPDFIYRAKQKLIEIAPDLVVNCFGHIGDGNLHYNVFPTTGKTKKDYALKVKEIKSAIYEVVTSLGGSISAEHGIGRLKVEELLEHSDPGKLQAIKSIKRALDPHGILNPGAIVADF